jgi:hypothetical protein
VRDLGRRGSENMGLGLRDGVTQLRKRRIPKLVRYSFYRYWI